MLIKTFKSVFKLSVCIFISSILITCTKDENGTITPSFSMAIESDNEQFYEGVIIPLSFESSSIDQIQEIAFYINEEFAGQTFNPSEIYYLDLENTHAGTIEIKAICSFNNNQSISNEIQITLLKSGIQCGELLTDIDGNQYNTILLGDQCWMQSNLRTTRQPNGELLINGLDTVPVDAPNEPPGWYAAYDRLPSNADIYGYLYSFYTTTRKGSDTQQKIKSAQGVCPDGWHVPTVDEWRQLINHLGGEKNAGKELKDNNENPNGFKALFGGYRFLHADWYVEKETAAYFWTSTPSPLRLHAYHIYVHKSVDNASIFRDINNKTFGMSVRCIKN